MMSATHHHANLDHHSIRFHQRIAGRAMLFVALPMIGIVSVVIVLNYARNFSRMRETGERLLVDDTLMAATTIQEANDHAVWSAQRMAEAQMSGMFGDRESSLKFSRMVLESSPQLTGAYFGYEPNADGRDAESLGQLDSKAIDDAGRFIPYWFVSPDKDKGIVLEPLVNMDTSQYYKGVKDAFDRTKVPAAMVTEPYVYQGKMIVEQTYPIIIEGQFKGVAGVDRALTDVERELRRLALELDVDAFLISSGGKFIAATTDPEEGSAFGALMVLKTQSLLDSAYRGLFGELFDNQEDGKFVVDKDPVDGANYYYASATIPRGQWLLILRRSEAAILAPIWSQLLRGIIIAVVGVLFMLVLLIVSAVRVGRRVHVAVEVADRVAHGDLTQALDTDGAHDETGVLLRAIGTMTSNLNDLIGQVKRSSIQLNSTATQMAASSREQDASVSAFGSSAMQIAAAVKQISASSSELSHTMGDVNTVARGTADLATSGQESLQDMESTMKSLADATESIGEKLAVINDRATNISGVITTITKVADQTNLLSVNAAIEAEKAGEFGIGFLVVAREIRRLADQTALATTDIERMVQQMQAAVSSGVMEMDRFSDRVRRSVDTVSEISTQMEQIIERVWTNTEQFDRVLESVNSQGRGTEQISQAMTQLTEVAEQSVQTNREFARAAGELHEAIAGLQSSISTFTLKG